MKKEKKLLFVFTMAMLFACQVNSQRLYLNAGVGYAFPAGFQVIGVNHFSTHDENVYGSFGKGFIFGAGIGYMFADYIGAELDFSYLAGTKYEIMNNAVLYSYKGTMFRIIPTLKVTGGDRVKPYAKFGFVFGVGGKVDVEISGVQGNFVISGTEKYSGGSSTGWLGAFGLDFKASDNLSVFVEFASITQSYKPDRFDATITSSNGNVSVTDVESDILVDNLPDGASGQRLAPMEPFSSLGINAGIKLMFGGGK